MMASQASSRKKNALAGDGRVGRSLALTFAGLLDVDNNSSCPSFFLMGQLVSVMFFSSSF